MELTTPSSLAIVLWVDSAYTEEPDDFDLAPMEALSVGILIAETPDAVVIALEWFKEDAYPWRRRLAIPKCSIKGLKILPFSVDDAFVPIFGTVSARDLKDASPSG